MKPLPNVGLRKAADAFVRDVMAKMDAIEKQIEAEQEEEERKRVAVVAERGRGGGGAATTSTTAGTGLCWESGGGRRPIRYGRVTTSCSK